MDDLTAMQSFRAERDTDAPEARKAIWHALEARMDAAAEAEASSEVPVGSEASAAYLGTRNDLRSRWRRLILLAGAAAAPAAVAVALVLSSGPATQPASAAEILQQAAAAASGGPATSVLGPGQFRYTRVVRSDVHGWLYPLPPASADLPVGGIGGTIKGPHAFNAIVPVTVESWTNSEGGGRNREEAGTPQFWSEAEEARWQAAGSPLPPPFNAEYQQRYKRAFKDANEIGPRVVDMNHRGWRNFHAPDTSKLPTEAKALRQQVEANEIEVSGFNLMFGEAPRHLDHEQTAEELFNVLREGRPTPQLQAAIFNALAELPGIKVDTDAIDGAGRHGAAIRTATKDGVRVEYLFDPEDGELFAQRTILVDPAAIRSLQGIPAGTIVSELDLLEEATVDSTTAPGQSTETPAPPGGIGPSRYPSRDSTAQDVPPWAAEPAARDRRGSSPIGRILPPQVVGQVKYVATGEGVPAVGVGLGDTECVQDAQVVRGFPHGHLAVEHVNQRNRRKRLADPVKRFEDLKAVRVQSLGRQRGPEFLVGIGHECAFPGDSRQQIPLDRQPSIGRRAVSPPPESSSFASPRFGMRQTLSARFSLINSRSA